jgi:hypothetical protein
VPNNFEIVGEHAAKPSAIEWSLMGITGVVASIDPELLRDRIETIEDTDLFEKATQATPRE